MVLKPIQLPIFNTIGFLPFQRFRQENDPLPYIPTRDAHAPPANKALARPCLETTMQLSGKAKQEPPTPVHTQTSLATCMGQQSINHSDNSACFSHPSQQPSAQPMYTHMGSSSRSSPLIGGCDPQIPPISQTLLTSLTLKGGVGSGGPLIHPTRALPLTAKKRTSGYPGLAPHLCSVTLESFLLGLAQCLSSAAKLPSGTLSQEAFARRASGPGKEQSRTWRRAEADTAVQNWGHMYRIARQRRTR